MNRQKSSFLAVVAVLFLLPGLFAQQSLEDRVTALEKLVGSLQTENAQLKETVAGFEATEADGVEEAIQEVVFSSYLGDKNLFRADGGFVNRMIWGGEWRTRADWRINTADLLSELDDAGFRLDYRFNLGVGFDLTPSGVDEGSNDLAVTTWFEFQAAGRGANNTAENIQSGIGVGIGDFATRENDLDVLRLYQAYINLDHLFGQDDFSLKIGRQEIIFGSQLIMGTNEFFTGTVHDAIRFDYGFDGNRISAFYAKEASSDGQVPPGIATGGLLTGQFRASGDEDEVMGLYGSFSFLDPVDVDAYYFFFNARDAQSFVAPVNVTSPNDPAIDAFGRSTLEGQIHTIGLWARSDRLVDDLFLSLEIAYQTGQEEDGDELDALLVELSTEYNLPFWEDSAPRIYFGYYFSEGPDHDMNNGFAPMFISRHNNDPLRGHGGYSRFGNVDLIPAQNVHVIQAGFKFEPSEEWIVGLTWLYAWANHSRAQFGINPLGTVFLDDRSIGHEVDVYAKYRLSDQTDFFLNASVFFPEANFVIDSIASGTLERFDTDMAFGLFAHIQVRF